MPANRVLSEEDIANLEPRTSDLIEKALDKGDIQTARTLLRRLVADSLALHDGYLEWITGMLSYVQRRYGDDVLLDMTKKTYGAAAKPFADAQVSGKLSLRERVEAAAAMLRVHAEPLKIEEDDDKITLMMDPCGSGARVVNNGLYASGHHALVERAQPQTFGRSHFPVYCTHCAVGEIMAIEQTGQSVFVMTPGAEIGKDRCRFHIYKDPRKVPADHFDKFKSRPAAK